MSYVLTFKVVPSSPVRPCGGAWLLRAYVDCLVNGRFGRSIAALVASVASLAAWHLVSASVPRRFPDPITAFTSAAQKASPPHSLVDSPYDPTLALNPNEP